MAKDIILGGFFVASADGTGKTGLTVTVDVFRVTLADLSVSQIVTGGSATAIGGGAYAYRVASADLQTYDYIAVFKTADTSVVQKHVAAVMLDFADAPGLVTLIWNALSSGLTTTGSIGKRLVDFLTGDIYARLGAPAGASVSADVAAVQADTNDIQSRLPAALTGDGNLKADALKLNGATPTNLTSTETAQAVLNATASSYNTTGTIGAKINAASASAGAGAISTTVTINNASNQPLDGAEVWVTTDSGGTNVVASGQTNTAGQVTFMLDAGSYYTWCQLAGHNFSNPSALTVS
jgi:hypothetical protein